MTAATLIHRIFPSQFDNRFDGHRLALWLLGGLLALKLLMSTNSILNTASVAVGADGFPLESYGAAGARAVLMLFALTSLGQLMLAVLGLLALVRYRAMVPLVYTLLLLEHVARRTIVQAYAVDRSGGGSTGLYINLALLGLLTAGFALSLWPRTRRSPAATREE